MTNQLQLLINIIERNYPENTTKTTKKLLSTSNKLAIAKERNEFLLSCKYNEIIPKFIQDKGKCFDSFVIQNHPFQHNIEKMKETLFKKMLNLEIKICRYTLKYLLNHVSNLNTELNNILPNHIYIDLKDLIKIVDSQTMIEHRKNLTAKFTKLKEHQRKIHLNFDPTDVINLTNLEIPQECLTLISYGPNFNLPPTYQSTNTIDLLADIENIFSQFSEDDNVSDLRTSTTNTLLQYKRKNKNKKVTRIDRILIDSKKLLDRILKDNNNIIITKSDKGNKTVIMEKDFYIRKLEDLINDVTTYKPINYDPTEKVNKNVHKVIDQLFKDKIINKQQKISLKIVAPVAPRIYGLPKIHKPGIPFRPIVSTITSPVYQLSKLIINYLKPLVENSLYNIKNSFQIKEILDNTLVRDDEILVSFDVISLFTNIPVDIARQAILERWVEIETTIPCTKQTFLKIFDLCVKDNNFFQFNNKYYQQLFGLAMGNPLSPILADIVLEKLLKEQIPKLTTKPTLLKKYVDDFLLSIHRDEVNSTLNIFNSFHEKIQFTVEFENINKEITFLDLKILRTNNKLITNWFSKDISSNIILNFHSSHPYLMKKNVAQSFINRVFNLSDSYYRNYNINRIHKILNKNNYPKKLINKLITKCLYTYKNKNLQNVVQNQNEVETKIIHGSITYIPHLTEKLKKGMHKSNYKNLIATKINNKISKSFISMKDKVPIDKKTGIVYNIPCECGKCYIGETSKTLNIRVNQHKCDVKFTDKNKNHITHHRSALCKHSTECDKKFLFDQSSILCIEPKKHKRTFKEMCHISKNTNSVNYKTDCRGLQDNYLSLLEHDKL